MSRILGYLGIGCVAGAFAVAFAARLFERKFVRRA
jgi:hypothetical protein